MIEWFPIDLLAEVNSVDPMKDSESGRGGMEGLMGLARNDVNQNVACVSILVAHLQMCEIQLHAAAEMPSQSQIQMERTQLRGQMTCDST